MTACSESTGSVEPPLLQNPPEEISEPCERPVELPLSSLTQLQVEKFWIIDRSSLIDCASRLDILTAFYKIRDQGIIGNE